MGHTSVQHTQKEGTVRFLTYFRKVNGQIVRKPFTITRIADTLQKLEGFTYATALVIIQSHLQNAARM